MSLVLIMSPLRSVHDIDLTSKKGRSFVIDIYDAGNGTYESLVTVRDRISKVQGSWQFQVVAATPSAGDNFKAAIALVVRYLGSVDETDEVADVHNACNCPFVPEVDQNRMLGQLGLSLAVRVN